LFRPRERAFKQFKCPRPQCVKKRNATNQETHLLFVDLTKAYDSIPILKVWEVLGEFNINNTLIKAL